jgi:hypothetical protein
MVDMRICRPNQARLIASVVAAALGPGGAASAGQAPPSPAPANGQATVAARSGAEPELVPVPPGSHADQALWKQAGEVGPQITTARTASNSLQWRIRGLDLVGRLDRAATAASAGEAKRLAALRERLATVQSENYVILTSQWPVDPTRGCQYPQLALESAMRVADGPDRRALLGQAREEAQRCVDAASLAVARLSRSNDALALAIDAAVKAVPWEPPADAPSTSGKD